MKVIRTIEYDEDINFATLKETDSSQYVGYERVKVEGVTRANATSRPKLFLWTAWSSPGRFWRTR